MNKQKDFYIKDGELICYLGDATDIIIPKGVNRIGMGAFIKNKNIRSVSLPESLTWIGQGAFADCENLKSITIPASVTFIDKCAFSDSGLEEVIIEGNPEIRLWAFDGTPWRENEIENCDSLKRENIIFPENAEIIKEAKELWTCGCGYLS